jgi:RAT1-interacting protein
MAELRPNPRYNEVFQFPSMSKPKIIGAFSLDDNRQYRPTYDNLKYLVLPKTRPSFDLNQGYENYRFKPDALSEKIDHLLTFIMQNLDKCRQMNDNNGETKRLKFDFVCFRGLLRLLMCTPYEFRDPVSVLATKYRGTVYLCANDAERQRQQKLDQSEAMKKILSYGFKFEQFILADSPKAVPNTSQPVVESEEFCCMFETRMGDLNVLYGAEMDGIRSGDDCSKSDLNLNQQEWVEVKAKLRESHPRQVTNYHKFKTRNWWCQSFLVGIDSVVVGVRNEAGIVQEIEEVSLRTLKHLGQGYWSPSVCMSFCIKFLKFVQQHTQHLDDPFTVVKFDWDPSDRSKDSVQYSRFEGPNVHSFLPEWYFKDNRETQARNP